MEEGGANGAGGGGSSPDDSNDVQVWKTIKKARKNLTLLISSHLNLAELLLLPPRPAAPAVPPPPPHPSSPSSSDGCDTAIPTQFPAPRPGRLLPEPFPLNPFSGGEGRIAVKHTPTSFHPRRRRSVPIGVSPFRQTATKPRVSATTSSKCAAAAAAPFHI